MTHASKRPLNPNARPWHPCRTSQPMSNDSPYPTKTRYQSTSLNPNAPEFFHFPSKGFSNCWDDDYSYVSQEDRASKPNTLSFHAFLDSDDETLSSETESLCSFSNSDDDSHCLQWEDDDEESSSNFYYLLETPNGPQRISEQEYYQTPFYRHTQLSGKELVRYKRNGREFLPQPTLQIDLSAFAKSLSPEWAAAVLDCEAAMNEIKRESNQRLNAFLAECHAKFVT